MDVSNRVVTVQPVETNMGFLLARGRWMGERLLSKITTKSLGVDEYYGVHAQEDDGLCIHEDHSRVITIKASVTNTGVLSFTYLAFSLSRIIYCFFLLVFYTIFNKFKFSTFSFITFLTYIWDNFMYYALYSGSFYILCTKVIFCRVS